MSDTKRKRPPTEAALLLLRVKRGLLSLHLLHQFFDPIERKLVIYTCGDAPVALDLGVEFDTLVTHFQFRICASLPITSTGAPAICSNQATEGRNRPAPKS